MLFQTQFLTSKKMWSTYISVYLSSMAGLCWLTAVPNFGRKERPTIGVGSWMNCATYFSIFTNNDMLVQGHYPDFPCSMFLTMWGTHFLLRFNEKLTYYPVTVNWFPFLLTTVIIIQLSSNLRFNSLIEIRVLKTIYLGFNQRL